MADEYSKFIQPADGIHITKQSGKGTLLPDHIIEIGRERIAAGEDPDEVAQDLALYELSINDDDDETPIEEEEDELKTLEDDARERARFAQRVTEKK